MLNYEDMFDYFKRERDGLIRALENLSDEEFMKNRGSSFDSMKNVLVHTVMVEDNWLHYKAAGLGEGTSLKMEARALRGTSERRLRGFNQTVRRLRTPLNMCFTIYQSR